jgi:hypothetical protein
MQHAKQVKIRKELMFQIDEKRNVDAGIMVENPVSSYICLDMSSRMADGIGLRVVTEHAIADVDAHAEPEVWADDEPGNDAAARRQSGTLGCFASRGPGRRRYRLNRAGVVPDNWDIS